MHPQFKSRLLFFGPCLVAAKVQLLRGRGNCALAATLGSTDVSVGELLKSSAQRLI